MPNQQLSLPLSTSDIRDEMITILTAMLANPATYTTLLGRCHGEERSLCQEFAEQATKQLLAMHVAIDRLTDATNHPAANVVGPLTYTPPPISLK